MPNQEKWDQGQWEVVGDLLDEVKAHLEPTDCTLIADRGLAGGALVKWCRDRQLKYLWRVCKAHTCRRQLGQGWRRWQALGHIILKEGQQWFGRVLLGQDQQTIETHLSAVWDTGHKEAWFLISDLPAGRGRVREYARRMRVESTFQDGKSRGWNLEASLIEDLARLNRLLLALFLAMWWVSHLAASCIHHGKREQFDRHDRRDKSIFRLGQLWLLDILRRATNPAALTWCLPFQRTGTTWKFALRFLGGFLLTKNKCQGERGGDHVIIAADTQVDMSHFQGKPVYETSRNAAINDGQAVVKNALAQTASGPAPQAGTADYVAEVQAAKAAQARSRRGPYKHLLTGVSYMIPFVVSGGIMIALGFAVGGINVDTATSGLGWALFQIGAKGAFVLFVPILAGYIAYSIADRPGLAPGMVGGLLSTSIIGAGVLGGIAAGFLGGYVVYWLNTWIRLPRNLAGLMPVLILPLLSLRIFAFLMIFLIGPPTHLNNLGLTDWLKGLQAGN